MRLAAARCHGRKRAASARHGLLRSSHRVQVPKDHTITGVIEEILNTVNDKLINDTDTTVERANSKMFRQIEELCEDRDGRPPIVVECAVDDNTTLLIFDVVVPNDLLQES